MDTKTLSVILTANEATALLEAAEAYADIAVVMDDAEELEKARSLDEAIRTLKHEVSTLRRLEKMTTHKTPVCRDCYDVADEAGYPQSKLRIAHSNETCQVCDDDAEGAS